jgi:hypothetical protein
MDVGVRAKQEARAELATWHLFRLMISALFRDHRA